MPPLHAELVRTAAPRFYQCAFIVYPCTRGTGFARVNFILGYN